jgi:hypothetical protein
VTVPKPTGGFSAKDRISHYIFGLGTISQANDRHITIVFDESGTRKFLTSRVRIEHSNTPAPPKPVAAKKKKAKKPAKAEGPA